VFLLELGENFPAELLRDPDVGPCGDLEKKQLDLIPGKQSIPEGLGEDSHGSLDGKPQAARLGSGQLVIEKNESPGPGESPCETQKVPFPSSQGRDGYISLKNFFGYVENREVVAFEKEADAERIRRITDPAFDDGLLVDGPRDVNGPVKLSEKVQAVQLAERDQRTGIDEDHSQALNQALRPELPS